MLLSMQVCPSVYAHKYVQCACVCTGVVRHVCGVNRMCVSAPVCSHVCECACKVPQAWCKAPVVTFPRARPGPRHHPTTPGIPAPPLSCQALLWAVWPQFPHLHPGLTWMWGWAGRMWEVPVSGQWQGWLSSVWMCSLPGPSHWPRSAVRLLSGTEPLA